MDRTDFYVELFEAYKKNISFPKTSEVKKKKTNEEWGGLKKEIKVGNITHFSEVRSELKLKAAKVTANSYVLIFFYSHPAHSRLLEVLKGLEFLT